jgi:hypothetical protein
LQHRVVNLPRCIFERGRDVIGFEQRVIGENFLAAGTRGQQVEYVFDSAAKAAQARPPAAHGRIDCHSVQFAHGLSPTPADRSWWIISPPTYALFCHWL